MTLPHNCKDCRMWYGAEDDEFGPCLVKSSRGDRKHVTHGGHLCDEVDSLSLADTVMDVRPIVDADLDFAVGLTSSVGWGYTREELAALLSYEPEGCLLATEDGNPVGMLTTTTYGDVGWIGNVVTREAVRGRGFGAALVNAAVEYMESRGVRSILLYAYEDTVAFYERLGFTSMGEALRVAAMGGDGGRERTGLTAQDLEAVLRLDRAAMGFSRERVLRALWDQDPGSFFVARRGDAVVGYAVGPRGEGEGEIGPWICSADEVDECRALLGEVLAASGPVTLSMTVPSGNAVALEAAEERGFEKVFRVVLMGKGPRPAWRDEMIFAMGSLEKG